MKKFILIVALALLSLYPQLAEAQSQRNPCYNTTNTPSPNCIPVGVSSPLPTSAYNSFTNITTNADTVIKATPGTLVGFSVNTAGVTSTAVFYNNTTCTGAKIGSYTTVAQTTILINAVAGTGICVTTAGGTPADITVLWR